MVGMLQILTYMFAFYLIVKGIEILQIALASGREKRTGIIALGVGTLVGCAIAALGFMNLQDRHAASIGSAMGGIADITVLGNTDYSSFSSREVDEAQAAADRAVAEANAALDAIGNSGGDFGDADAAAAAQAAADTAAAAAQAAADAAAASR